MKSTPITETLKSAQRLIQQKQFSAATNLLQPLAAANPADDRIFSLLGVAHASSENMAASLENFRKCVELRPGQAGHYRNLANALVRTGQDAEAIEAYESALRLVPGNEQLLYNLALALQRLGRSQEALNAVRQLLKGNQQHADAWLLQAHLEHSDNNEDAALEAYDRCLALAPKSITALHGKSIILKHRKQWSEACEAAGQVVRLNPNLAGVHLSLASCHAALGQVDQAVDAYREAIRLEPLKASFHGELNQLLWIQGREEFLDSYFDVLKSNPRANALRRELAYKLIQVNRLEDAQVQTRRLLEDEPRHAENHQLHGGVLRKRRLFSEAVAAHRECALLDPTAANSQRELATSLMANEEALDALNILNQLRDRDAEHQGTIALRSTALRMLGREEYHYICDYENLVFSALIEPPPGYASLAAFNAELEAYLDTLHSSREHPLDQSLVNGTQTIDDLFDDPHELIQMLKNSLDETTRRLFRRMPEDPLHPALSRKREAYRYAGAWSVRLRSGGYHLNHYHDLGWYSGPYYIGLPLALGDEQTKAGWLKLGEPGFECTSPLPPERTIRPEPGLMVRFPSYMWHGTVPFDSDETRTVVSLDLNPV